MNSVIFIASEQLGATLESTLRGMTTYSTKRERAAEARRIARVCYDLKLIDVASWTVTGVAYGVRSDGTAGLFVTLEPATHIIGKVGA